MKRDFRNVRIFLVEDEFLVASALQEDLEGLGFQVFGPYPTLGTAQAAAGDGPYDVAIIDMNLRGELAFPVADALMKRRVPVIILTGYSFPDLPARFRNITTLSKPYDIDITLRAVEKVLAAGPATA